MKKILPAAFLLIFLFNAAGYYIAFKTEQFQIKEEIESEIRSGLNPEQLTIITINKAAPSAVQWIEYGKEMRYKNDLYDVVRSDEDKNTITYYCINDAKEDSLAAALNDHIDRHIISNKPDKNSKKTIDTIIKLYFCTSFNALLPPSCSTVQYQCCHLNFISPLLEKNALPPELA